MSAKNYTLEITLFYLLLLVPWPQNRNVVKLFCSKDNSGLVRKIILSRWTPILDKYQVKFPLECPLHPLRDIFGPREEAKKKHRPTQWTCKLCGKSFYKEQYVDDHIELRHKYLINKAEDSVCLSDFCDIMRCDVFRTAQSKLAGSDPVISTDIEVWGASSFGKSSAISNPNYNLSPIRDSSVLTGIATTKQDSRVEPFCDEKVGVNKPKSISPAPVKIKVSDNKSKAEEDSSSKTGTVPESNPGNNDSTIKIDVKLKVSSSRNDSPTVEKSSETESFINMSKIRANCQSEELDKLKSKCEFIVRTCVGSLLLKMSDDKFKEMEAELNKAVCWYLTCERYWEDGPLAPRAFPWVLIFILTLILSLGICFCYYIIWILFDTEDERRLSSTQSNQQMYQTDPYLDYQPIYHPVQHQAHIDPLYDYRHSPRYIPHHPTQPSTMDMLETSTMNNMQMQMPSSSVIVQDCDKDPSTGLLRSTDLNEISHNEHYIYVTYPPDLKKRLYDKYEG